jgi:hypothetical protein
MTRRIMAKAGMRWKKTSLKMALRAMRMKTSPKPIDGVKFGGVGGNENEDQPYRLRVKVGGWQ